MPPAEPPPLITVLAGVNGAGKSSIFGPRLRELGGDYLNPDEFTRDLLARNPGLDPAAANQVAWERGRDALERAILERRSIALETTLGGRTITRLLERALLEGLRVEMAYVGLDGLEMHIRRVAARVAQGGHDIDTDRIRQRFTDSRLNLVRLMPNLSRLLVYDNSREADLPGGQAPDLLMVVETAGGRTLRTCGLDLVPGWAKPVVEAALQLPGPPRPGS